MHRDFVLTVRLLAGFSPVYLAVAILSMSEMDNRRLWEVAVSF